MPLLFSKKVKNRYQLRERLGTGGMGIVYRARDTVINADIALKTLTDTTDPVALRMFREECDKLAKIIHPNVVEIRDAGEIEDDGARKPYMVMPFLRGKTLDRLLVESPGGLPLDRALEILLQASRGLHATHEAGLIHRDIKPSNIFVLEDDSVKLIDFGVAHYAENLLTVTRKGTLMYMAPEQVMMQGTSPASDIFSLGVVAYETLTGRRPFEGKTEKDLIDSILHRNPPPASSFNSQLNSAIDQTLQKALAKLPKYRFQSAREFGDTLRKAVLNQRIAMFEPGRIELRIEQARSLIGRGELDTASGIIHQLELQGWLDERIELAKQEFERLRKEQTLGSLLDTVRSEIEAQDYTAASTSIEEALELDPQNDEANRLRQEIERTVAARRVTELLSAAGELAETRRFGAAKAAVDQALETCPNDPAALELRRSVQRQEQEHGAILNEKRRAIHRAERAMEHSDPEKAWQAIQKAIHLDSATPEPDDAASDLKRLSDRISSALQDAQKSLERARALFRSGDLNAALVCCSEALGRLPQHTALRTLKLDIQEKQTSEAAELMADMDREIRTEPDLDRRIELLKSASERFSQLDNFASSYRVAREKRDFADALAAEARTAEQEQRPGDAREAWQLVRSLYPAYPGLDAGIARLEQRQDLQTYEQRADLLRQINSALEAREFEGALHLLRVNASAFAGDQEFVDLLSAAEKGAERERLAGDLLDTAAQLTQQHRYEDALGKLAEAAALDVRNREIAAVRHHVLVEQARSLVGTDASRAIKLLNQALEAAPGNDNSKRLLEVIEARARRERVDQATDRIRQLERTHDFDGALRAAEEASAQHPEVAELAQTAARLKRRGERGIRPVAHPPSSSDTPGRALLWAAWEKASALAHRSRGSSGSVRTQVLASSRRDEGGDGGGIAFAEQTPSNTTMQSPPDEEAGRRSFAFPARGMNSVPVILVGSAVVLAIVLGLLLAPRHTPRVRVVPHQAAVPPPARPSPASVPLHVDPADALLTVDGTTASLRNGVLAIQPGTHTLEARAPGYEPLSRSVEVAAAGNAALQIALVPIALPPTIHVETDLEAGSVLMDDRPAGALEGGQFYQDAPDGSHTIAVLAPSGGRYFFPFTLGHDPVWSVGAPKSTTYGTPVLAALSSSGARIICGHSGLAFELDGGQAFVCTAAGKNLPALANGHHTLTLLEGSRTIAVHALEYQGSPVLAALITTGAQFGGLAIQGTEQTFDVSVNGYASKRAAKGGHWRRLLKPGNYTITVSKPGFNANPPILNVSVAPGIDTVEQISFRQVPERASLRLQSQPGTEVSLNGKSAGVVPEGGILELPQLTAGNVDLHLHHKGFADVEKAITLASGENQRSIALQELKAKITWTVDPPSAAVTYSLAGEASRHQVTGNAIELPAGTYYFEASAPGGQSTTSIVTVGSGETKTLSLKLTTTNPAVRDIASWSGWDTRGGWLVREKPGSLFETLPEHATRVTFTAGWERSKTLVHWTGDGALNLVFRSADGARSVGFRITEHNVTWTAMAQGQRRDGKFQLNLAKNPEKIEADINSSGTALTVNGSALSAVGPNLSAESKPIQFGFIIDQDQTVRLTGIRVIAQTAATN